MIPSDAGCIVCGSLSLNAFYYLCIKGYCVSLSVVIVRNSGLSDKEFNMMNNYDWFYVIRELLRTTGWIRN